MERRAGRLQTTRPNPAGATNRTRLPVTLKPVVPNLRRKAMAIAPLKLVGAKPVKPNPRGFTVSHNRGQEQT